MHFEALLEPGLLTAGFVVSNNLPAAFTFAVDFLAGVGLVAALKEQFLLVQWSSITNEPHSQNSAKHITPFLNASLKLN